MVWYDGSMTNQEIAKIFRNVAAAYAIIDEKKHYFQMLAYQKAADVIQNSASQMDDLVKNGELTGFSGIGSGLKEHIEELIKKGKSSHLDSILSKVPASVFPLLEIPSIGPKKAYKLVTALKLNDPKKVIDQLEEKAKEGKITKLETFGEKSQSDILRAIEEFRKGAGKTTRMLLPMAFEISQQLITYLKKSPHVVEVNTMGSLRRRSPTVGDLDIAVATKNKDAVLDYFTKYPNKMRVIEKGTNTSSIITSSGTQVDLMTVPVENYGNLIQHFTGGKHHNVHLREVALRKGFSISEYGAKHKIKGKEEILKFTDEKKVYETLGMEYIPPELREDRGEIELALAHKLPKLIEEKDIKGDFHIHTSYPIEPSHDMGLNSMQEMLDKAKSLKYEYLAFSDHNPSQSQHTKEQVFNILKRRREKIEQLKKSNKSVRVISMLEVDILPNGKLAIDDKCFEYLDAVIVSIHSVFKMDKEKMTERIIKGLSHPKAKILAHPTGRLLGKRAGYEINLDKIIEFAKKNKKALEINAWPERSDLPDDLIKKVVEAGVMLTIDTDSHAKDHMDLMKYGVWQARRGFATKHDILNAKSYNEVAEFLEIK